MDLLGTVSLVVEGLGDTPREVLAPLLAEIEARELAQTSDTGVLAIHPPQQARERRGPRGGMSGAERTARWRAKAGAPPIADVTANPSHDAVTVTVTPVTPVTPNPSPKGRCDGVTPEPVTHSVTVTDHAVTQDPSRNGRGDGVTVTPVTVTGHVTARPSPIRHRDGDVTDSEHMGGFPALPEVPPSQTLPSPTSPTHPTHHVPRAPAREGQPPLAGFGVALAAGPTSESEPPEGSAAATALAALRQTRVLWGIVKHPASLAVAVAAGAYPALDVPQEILRAEAWLVANPKNRKSDGARYLNGWLARAQDRAPRVDERRVRPADRPRRVGPAPVASAEDFARDAEGPDPLIALAAQR
jgi:hypothetical protein